MLAMTAWRALLGILLIAAALGVSTQLQPTAPGDVDALAAIAAAVSPLDGTVLAGWDAYVDPCAGWPGVLCNCSSLPARVAANCNEAAAPSSAGAGPRRVLGLDLGPLVSAGMKQLQGTLSPAIGNLTALLYLDASGNQLRWDRRLAGDLVYLLVLLQPK